MKKFVLLLSGSFALAAISCEKHPLPGEPPAPLADESSAPSPGSATTGEQHSGGKTVDAKQPRDEGAQPGEQPAAPAAAEGAKPGEPRKFFPESSEKK
jgi:hypothetical protein